MTTAIHRSSRWLTRVAAVAALATVVVAIAGRPTATHAADYGPEWQEAYSIVQDVQHRDNRVLDDARNQELWAQKALDAARKAREAAAQCDKDGYRQAREEYDALVRAYLGAVDDQKLDTRI